MLMRKYFLAMLILMTNILIVMLLPLNLKISNADAAFLYPNCDLLTMLIPILVTLMLILKLFNLKRDNADNDADYGLVKLCS